MEMGARLGLGWSWIKGFVVKGLVDEVELCTYVDVGIVGLPCRYRACWI